MRLLIFVLVLFLAAPVFAQDVLTVNDSLLTLFYDLWKDSGFGHNPYHVERAAWIYLEESGEYGQLRWPQSEEPNKEFWIGPIPRLAIAQAHTHPVVTDPRPSSHDVDVCKRLAIPLYTISGSGIWVVTPDGKMVQILPSNWWTKYR